MLDLPLLICQRACSHLNVCVQACAPFLAAVGGLTCSKCEGGVEAMTAKQNAARKHAGAALAAVRTSAAATISSATPGVTSGITNLRRCFCLQGDHHPHPAQALLHVTFLCCNGAVGCSALCVLYRMSVTLNAGPEAHQQDPDSTSAAKPALEPKAFFSAQPSRPSGSSTQPSTATAGSRERLTAKLGLAPKSALGRRLPGASRPTAVICQPGQSGTSHVTAFIHRKRFHLRSSGMRVPAPMQQTLHCQPTPCHL